MEQLVRYFTSGIEGSILYGKIGAEIETSFVTKSGTPISLIQSQEMFRLFADRYGAITQKKGELIAEVRDRRGNRLLYELGRQNIELATNPEPKGDLIPKTREILERIYGIGLEVGAYPRFKPILETDEDLLVVPDERDAGWIRIDGREALKPLARISAVQFTIPVCPHEAIMCLNRLGKYTEFFRAQYPQDRIWWQYIRESHARYDLRRYGGPLLFRDLSDYCVQLSAHHWVDTEANHLVPINKVHRLNIPLYLRSIWWYFRLKRYGNQLCIEVRPPGRYGDDFLERQLDAVMNIMLFGKEKEYSWGPPDQYQERTHGRRT